jgi:NhaP-type Na+/H+ or K+/H+ antiporter
MVHATSAQIGLLAFAVAVIAGTSAGNTMSFVLTRALLAMLVGAVVGQVAGWTAKVVLRDHLQRKKLEIDRQHFEAVRAMELAAPAAETVEQAEPVEV